MPKKLWPIIVAISIINLTMPVMDMVTNAISCPDVKIIFARGSGGERWIDQNYLSFKDELSRKLELIDLSYEFEDLDYPAIGIGNISTLLSTFVGRGEAYEFGESVNLGVRNLISEVNHGACKNTRFVVAGYSQGAMVVSKAIQVLNPEKIIYAATFGDPKIYLPEGKGLVPAACKGSNLSNYRIYVPDCRVYEGMLGSYRPYQPDGYFDKLGTWCNKTDIFCSTHFSINAHTSYVSDGLYADASKLIFDKICQAFGINNTYVSLHDTAILIDSTGSMSSLIERYKKEALNLATKTLETGGRVALYDYRDIADGYEPRERCNFETCTIDSFKNGLDAISADDGGDTPESLLSASFKIMQKLNWKFGSTKSVVVLTDASYHNPDLDGTTFAEVVNLSKKIDPVNFYFVTPGYTTSSYKTFAEATDGMVVSSTSDLSVLTDNIISRYDSLPRVEDFNVSDEILPEIADTSFEKVSDFSVKISWSNTGNKTMVVLNDFILGITEGDSIVINDLDFEKENIVSLVPIRENVRGNTITLNISETTGRGSLGILKAPNAGKR